jgi:hypothetical protein
MFGVDSSELIIIALAALTFIGPKAILSTRCEDRVPKQTLLRLVRGDDWLVAIKTYC